MNVLIWWIVCHPNFISVSLPFFKPFALQSYIYFPDNFTFIFSEALQLLHLFCVHKFMSYIIYFLWNPWYILHLYGKTLKKIFFSFFIYIIYQLHRFFDLRAREIISTHLLSMHIISSKLLFYALKWIFCGK